MPLHSQSHRDEADNPQLAAERERAARDLEARVGAEVEELARQAMRIEKHYGCPMDIEWAKDGVDGRLRIRTFLIVLRALQHQSSHC